MSRAIASGIYELYGRFYDAFELLFKRRLARAISAIPFHSGDRVLDIGIGTGLSLQYYPSFVRVTGIDLSAGMLRQARRKVDRGLVRAHCSRADTVLLQADALNLPFADKAFDVVFCSHVISTVPNPQRCLAEALRVAGDHACLALVNHFRSPYPVVSWVETAIDPLCRKLGWRCDLSLPELLRGANVENLDDIRRRRGGGGGEEGVFRIVYLQKNKQSVRIVSIPAPVAREPRLA